MATIHHNATFYFTRRRDSQARQNYNFVSNITVLAILKEIVKFVTAIALVKGVGNISFKIDRINKQNEKSFVLGQIKSVKWFSN